MFEESTSLAPYARTVRIRYTRVGKTGRICSAANSLERSTRLMVFHHADFARTLYSHAMNRLLVPLILVVATARLEAQVQQRPRATTGPSAASLATPSSGPLKFDPHVLAKERAGNHDANPITRASRWRYRYSSPFNGYWGGYGYVGNCGYRGCRPFGFFVGGSSLGWWGPY
jgi:hypothetical protein